MGRSYTFNPFTGNFDAVSTVTVGVVGVTPNTSGASISGDQVLTLQPADSTNPGVITAATQSIGGGKTIVGNADETQLTVRGNAAPNQTSHIVLVERSNSDSLFSIADSGDISILDATTLTSVSLNTNDQVSIPSNPFTLRTGNSEAGGSTTGALTLKSGDRTTNGGGNSGTVTLSSGNTTANGVTSGAVTISSGTTSTTGAGSGSVSIVSGYTANHGSNTGAVTVSSGTVGGFSSSGSLTLTTGATTVTGSGSATLSTGNCTSAASGNISILPGTTSGTRGKVTVGGGVFVVDIAYAINPASAYSIRGAIYYNTTLNAFRYYNGTAWVGFGSSGLTVKTEYHTITAPEAAAQSFSLAFTPTDGSSVMCDVRGGAIQVYNVDFTISGSTFNWAGYALSGVLVAGDIVRLNYQY